MREFDSICGYALVKRELEQIADFLRHPSRYEKLGARMPAGLLIDGKPGLGKTLMANCLIQASGLQAFTCRKTKNGDGMLKAIRKVFARAAENAPAIVFLDDMDKFSNSDYNLCDTQEYVTVQSCIDECKGKGVFVIATTNNSGRLPKSLIREGRFDRVIRLEPPQGSDAFAIVNHYLSGKPSSLDVSARDVSDLVEGHSCAFLETVINEASLLAGFERARSISLEHFIKAYARVEGKGMLAEPDPAEDAPGISDAWATERAQVAYHEAGHVVVSEALRPKSASFALLLSNQGRLAGLMKERRLNRRATYAELKTDVLTTLAGGVAVEQKFGVPATGCGDDNKKAFAVVTELLTDASYLGDYLAQRSDYDSTSTLNASCEEACAALVAQFRWETRELIARNWSAVERIAEALYSRGYATADDIAAALGESGEAEPQAARPRKGKRHAA